MHVPAVSDLTPDSPELADLHALARLDGREGVVSAIIVDGRGCAFVQRRSAGRTLLPGCWDIAGGHVEPGETLHAALAREIEEETGWRLICPLRLLAVSDWEAEHAGRPSRKREFTFLVAVAGDLAAPRLEHEKVSEFRWVGPDELETLGDNRDPADTMVRELVRSGLDAASDARTEVRMDDHA
jgi:8-oxo-dGTP pyrophosphatase MutT (NUDIX family)